jgi:hypothetical protein
MLAGGHKDTTKRPVVMRQIRLGPLDERRFTACLQNPQKIIERFQQLGCSATPKKIVHGNVLNWAPLSGRCCAWF